MRIAPIAPLNESVPPKFYGDTERVVSYLTEELAKMGHEVTLFASSDSKQTRRAGRGGPLSRGHTVRAQIFLSDKLKIEPWFVNGWQSYGKFNKAPGIGGQVLWRPNGNVSLIFNNYWGQDTPGNPGRKRFHNDDSIQVKYYNRPDKTLSKAAFSFTFDAGCEYGERRLTFAFLVKM